jgi:hypothetical protein
VIGSAKSPGFLSRGSFCAAAKTHSSIFTFGAHEETHPDVVFPQEKPHFAALACAE